MRHRKFPGRAVCVCGSNMRFDRSSGRWICPVAKSDLNVSGVMRDRQILEKILNKGGGAE